jgi:hypothetical protein
VDIFIPGRNGPPYQLHLSISELLIKLLDWLEKDYREVVDPLGRQLTFRLSAKHTPMAEDKMAADLARMSSPDGPVGGFSMNWVTSGYEHLQKGIKYYATDENINDLFKKGLKAAWELKELGRIDKFFLVRSAYSPFKLLLNMEDAEDRYPFVTTSRVRPESS